MEIGNTQERLRSCVVYTQETCISGKMVSLHVRFSDSFNALRGHHLQLTDATVTTVGEERTQLQPADVAIVSVPDIIFCHPLEDDSSYASGGNVFGQERTPRFMVAHAKGGITVVGLAHLPPDMTMPAYIAQQETAFLPVTQGQVFQGEGRAGLPFVLLNTRHLLTVYETQAVPMMNGRALPPLAEHVGWQDHKVTSIGARLQNGAQPATASTAQMQGRGGVLTRLVEARQSRIA